MSDDEMREHVGGSMEAKVIASMAEAEQKAWEALAGYKFWMFGYHAARWVNYNQLLPQARRFRSPFAGLCEVGRRKADARQMALPEFEIDGQLLLERAP